MKKINIMILTTNDFFHTCSLQKDLKIVKGDVNGDQLEDFILLGATNQVDKLFLQNKNGTFDYSPQSAFDADSAFEGSAGILFDSDNDNDLDLLLGAGGNEYQKGIEGFLLRFYENDGTGNFTKAKEKTPQGGGNISVILSEDFDKDGDLDVFIGGRTVPGNYGLIPTSFLFRNEGNGVWKNVTPPFLAGVGMVTDGVWSDIDKDGNQDLVLVGEWMPVTAFKNNGTTFSQGMAIPNSYGWWNTIEVTDLDKDGDEDFILGNWGENSKFKASPEKPLSMFVKDFDNNGKSEFIINWYPPLDDQSYPFASKMDITSQLPGLKRTNLKYEDYANKTYNDLFSAKQRKQAMGFKADFLKNAILINKGDNFELVALPKEAQVSPVFSIIADDLDGNNTIDLLLFGNLYDLKPEVGRYDANFGVFLQGDGKGNFNHLPSQESGIFVKGQVRDATIIDIPGKAKTFIIGRNDDHVLLFQQNKNAIPQP